MRNEGAEIGQEENEQMKRSAEEFKVKAKEAGTAAMDATRAAYHQLENKTIACSRATDEAIRQNPYMAVGIAFGVGMLFGWLSSRGRYSEK